MKYSWTFIALIISALALTCSTPKPSVAVKGVAEGIIHVIGNEPFTKLALFTSDTTSYVLKCTKEIEKILNGRQGQKVKIQYEKIEQSPEGLTMTVLGINKD